MLTNSMKRTLIASFFFALSLPTIADELANKWYRMGYEYSQKGQNDKAFHWMKKAADSGNIAAQNNIGLSYLHGLGVKKDVAKAFNYFEKAANQGLSYAQSELAMLYYQQKQYTKAYDWWSVAAEQEDEYAQFNLASLFLEQNHKPQAHYWLKRANTNGHPDAKAALVELEKIYVK